MANKEDLSARRDKLSAAKQALLEKRLQSKKDDSKPSTIPRRPQADMSPLSFAQERMWFLNQLEPDNPAYNRPSFLRLRGGLNVAVLERSLNEIVRRHEVLRTVFQAEDGRPFQVVAPTLSLSLSVLDLGDLSETEREEEVRRLALEETKRPFDLAVGPLLRANLLRLRDEEHLLLLVTHHILFDGWSMGVLHRELRALYEAFSAGNPSTLPELPIQYADFAHWQRGWMDGDILQEGLAYWRQQLDGAPPGLELPTDRPRPAVQTSHGARRSITLPKALSRSIKELSQGEGVTIFMTLLAAFGTLLHRYTDQDDIVVGSPVAGRNRIETEGLIGVFINTLVLRTDLSGNPTFWELLGRVRESALEAYAHQDLPFEKLVDELKPERNLSHTPLVQVMFNYEDFPDKVTENKGLRIDEFESDNKMALFDLTLEIVNKDEELSCKFEYNTDLFEEDTMERMLGHYETLLEGIIASSEQRLSELPLLRAAERHQLLVEWNDTRRDYPKDKTIHQSFEAQVERTPEAVAVVFEDQQLTYQELNDRSNQLAHHLRRLGVGPETLVGICVERSLEMMVGVLGALKSGGAYVPLDPTYPKERLAFMLEDIQTPMLLTQQRLVEGLPQHRADVVCLDTDWQAIAQESVKNPLSAVTADNLAYVIYTSGSTGKPKGVSVPHRSINRLVFNTDYINLESSDRIAQASNFSFDAATFEIWGALLHGARLVGIDKDVVLSPKKFAAKIQEQSISVLFLTTALFNQIVQEAPEVFSSVRHLLFGGEAVDPKWVKNVLQNGPPKRLLHVYGPTESTTFASWYLVEGVEEGENTIPIGSPISNTQIYLLDHHLQPVPVGVPGELCIGGDGLAREYLNHPELTTEKFVPNPFSSEPGERLYKTGDLARYLPDGHIKFLGRGDDQIKIRGFRVELGEIEVVLGRHPTVGETVVLAREDNPGDKRLVAYIIPKGRHSPTTGELRGFLKEKLPDYMLPSYFVILDRLPVTPNGKVARRSLPAPDTARPELEEIFVAPHTPLEGEIAKTWSQVLGLEEVGIHDNFFELGGHSLLATQIISRLCEAFRIELPLRSLFESPTVAELAHVITTNEKKPGTVEKIALVLDRIEGMSEADMVKTLQEKRRERGNR